MSILSNCLRAALAWLAVSQAEPAPAAGKTCLLEAQLHSGVTVLPLRDCMVSSGIGFDGFAALCKSIAEIGASLGALPKATHPASCPTPPRGTCAQIFGAPIRACCDARSAVDLQLTRSTCIAQDGK